MSIDKQQRDAEWTRHYGLAMHILREGMHFEDGSVPPALEDLIADAMAHAWVRFEQLCDKRPDAPAKSRVRWAAKTGVLRVKSRRRFVVTRQHGYVDALDHRSADELLDAQDKPVTGYRDPSDFSNAEAIIAGLPEQLKPIARLFSFGRSKADVSRVREIPLSSLWEIIKELRKHIPDCLPEPNSAETETEPVRKFCPVRAMVTAIAIAYEHNRCFHPESIAYVDDDKHVTVADRRSWYLIRRGFAPA